MGIELNFSSVTNSQSSVYLLIKEPKYGKQEIAAVTKTAAIICLIWLRTT